jgi:predicted O-methyltransferase YrrM
MGLGRLEDLWKQAVDEQKRADYGCDASQFMHLAWLAGQPGVRRVAEIGFNAGYSSYAFLAASPDTTVVSFDLAEFEYSGPAKVHIDREFPGRHELIVGRSQQTVPQFSRDRPDARFDLILIDGDHQYISAMADLLNMRALATPRSVLVVDDLTPWKLVGIGPTLAWQQAVSRGFILPGGLFRDGQPVASIEGPGNRLWGVARYA